MDFYERIEELASKVAKLHETIETEEATKNAFIMPFISNVLRYDVFDPTEVVPEYTADTGSKKGEKVDYAIIKDDAVQILIECKKSAEPLKDMHKGQLARYFHVTSARIAILTNGIQYQFYTDLDSPNIMDEKPFLEIDMFDLKEHIANELKQLTKESFDIDSVLSSAGDLKYTKEIQKEIANLFENPDEEFIKMIAGRVYEGTRTQKVIEQFTILTKQGIKDYLFDYVRNRFEGAMDRSFSEYNSKKQSDSIDEIEDEINIEDEDSSPKIITTDEEIEGFHIVKSLLRQEVQADRITHRDTQSYFGVLLDDNNRKPICRLHFNRNQKYIGVFDSNKNETRHPIESLDDIYKYSDALVETIGFYS